MALGIASFCAVESVHGDYGVAANKTKQKAQEIQDKSNIPNSIKNKLFSTLNGNAVLILSMCSNSPPSFPCNYLISRKSTGYY